MSFLLFSGAASGTQAITDFEGFQTKTTADNFFTSEGEILYVHK